MSAESPPDILGELSKSIGMPCSVDTVKSLAASIESMLTGHTAAGRLGGFSVGSFSRLWDTMRTTEKLQWFAFNRILPWIGKAVREQHAEAIRMYELATVTDPDVMLPKDIPSWATSSPFDIIIAEVTVTPTMPTLSITFTASLPK